jgi:hypothetical protein
VTIRIPYTLAQVRKMVTSFVVFAAVIAAFFIHFNPNLTQALAVLVGAAFGVVGVFTAKHHSPDDAQKALEHMKGAALTVLGFYAKVPASAGVKISALIGVFVSGYMVYLTRNAPVPTTEAQLPPPDLPVGPVH